MKVKELIARLQEMDAQIGDVDVIVRGRLGFLAEIEDVTDDRSHDDDEPFASIDVDEDEDADYDLEEPFRQQEDSLD